MPVISDDRVGIFCGHEAQYEYARALHRAGLFKQASEDALNAMPVISPPPPMVGVITKARKLLGLGE